MTNNDVPGSVGTGTEGIDRERVDNFVAQYGAYDKPYFTEADTLEEFDKREALLPVLEQISARFKRLSVEIEEFLGSSDGGYIDFPYVLEGPRKITESLGDDDFKVLVEGMLGRKFSSSQFGFETKNHFFELSKVLGCMRYPMEKVCARVYLKGDKKTSLVLAMIDEEGDPRLEAADDFINDPACRSRILDELGLIIETVASTTVARKAGYLAKMEAEKARRDKHATGLTSSRRAAMHVARELLVSSLRKHGGDEVVSGIGQETADASSEVLGK